MHPSLHTTRAAFQYLQTRQVFNKHQVKVAAGFYVNKYLENKSFVIINVFFSL